MWQYIVIMNYTFLNAELPWMTLMVYIWCTSFCFYSSDLVWRDWEQFDSKFYYNIKTQIWFFECLYMIQEVDTFSFWILRIMLSLTQKDFINCKRTNTDTQKPNRTSILLDGSCMVNLAHACGPLTVLCLLFTKPTS